MTDRPASDEFRSSRKSRGSDQSFYPNIPDSIPLIVHVDNFRIDVHDYHCFLTDAYVSNDYISD
jgi:hypothetical protein